MTGAVSAYIAPSSAVSTHTTPTATSQSTASVRFDVPILRFGDLPAEARRLAPDAGVLAEVVIAIPGLGVRNGVTTQKRLAFHAYPSRIVVVTASRQVTKLDDGRYKPAGSWSITDSQVLTTVAGTRAARRTGTIAPGTLTDGYATSAGGPAPSRERVDGVTTEAYLPAEVRARLAHEIPLPETHLGQLTRWERRSGAVTQEVVVLRKSGADAIVVMASRPDRADAPWAVTQYTYALETGARALGR